MGQPRSASPPPALPRPLPPPPPPPSTARSVWRLPYSEKGKAEHSLSLCNYLSGTACEASATSPQPCKKMNYTHALGDTDGTTLPCTPQRARLCEERAAQASPGLLITCTAAGHPSSLLPALTRLLSSFSARVPRLERRGRAIWPLRSHGC